MALATQSLKDTQLEIPAPSVDSFGRITYIPTVKGYRPATEELLGKRVDIITDLNTSEVMQIKRNGRNAKQLITRVYSMKSNGKSGKLIGHASRFVLSNVTHVIWEKGRQKVLMMHSKTPHSWLRGTIVEILSNDDYERHNTLTREFLKGYNIAYNPYLDGSFRCLKNKKYITDSGEGVKFMSALEIYCYEDGILAK